MSGSDNDDNHNDGKISSGGPKQNIKDSLRPPLPKRFYKEAERVPCADGSGFEIRLDGRPLRTPLKRILVIPNEAFADLVLSEWRAQSATIDPASMPATRLANSAVDTVADNREAVAAEIVAYSGSDLLCYRAAGPASLVARQNEVWDLILQSVESALGARFIRAEGVMHVDQPSVVSERVNAAVADLPDLQLAAVQLVTTLTGSAVLGIALLNHILGADAVWAAAHLDEDWQIEQWGPDDDAQVRRAIHERDFRAAASALDALN
jgi:chaperone required for assembly of F1-ATPase